jgi:hypothetical protein
MLGGRAVAGRPRRAGYNTIDAATASRRGIYVSNCPAKTRSPSPAAFALLLSLDRRIPVTPPVCAGPEQEGCSKARVCWPHAGPLGYGHRAGDGEAPTRSACRSSSEPPVCDLERRRPTSSSRLACGVADGSAGAERHVLTSTSRSTRNTGPGQRVSPRQAETGGLLHQHGPRRSGRLRGARASGS